MDKITESLLRLEDLLDRGLGELGPEMLQKVIKSANALRDGITHEAWEALGEKIRRAFKLSDTEMANVLGVHGPIAAVEKVRVPFEELVKDGWLGRYIEYTAESESPAQFHFGAAITTLAAALQRRPLITWSVMPTYPNLYVLLIGPTGSRKSSALQMASTLIHRAVPTLHILPAEGTHQGYARALRRRYAENGKHADGLILASEYGVLVSKEKHKVELPKWLTDWYDSPSKWSRALSQEEYYEIENLYVSVCGCSNITWLKDIPLEAIKGGFLPRHLIFDAQGRRHRKAMPRFDARLATELVDALALRMPTTMETMGFDQAAETYITQWYEGELADAESKIEDEQILAWYARKQSHAIRLATVWQLVDGGPPDMLHVEWLHRARMVVDWCDNAVAAVYGQLGVSEDGECTDAVMRLLEKYKEMPQFMIQRKLRNKYMVGRVKMALDTLRGARLIESVSGDVARGSVWRLRK